MTDRASSTVATGAPTKARRHLTTGAIGTTLLAFAPPTLASSVLQSLNGSINTFWAPAFRADAIDCPVPNFT